MTIRHDADHDAVCASPGRHLVVTAPPGTGKTLLSVRLAAQLSVNLEPVQRVLLVTFSNQARTQLEREAERQLAPDVRARVEVTNYHGFFRRAVWAYRRALGLPLESSIGTYGRRLQAFEAVGRKELKRLSRHDGLLDAFAEQRFERFRDERTPEQGLRERLLAMVTEQQRSGRLVFDDLGALFWGLLDQYPVLDAAYRYRYPVVIADEHQDASELQDAVVRRLGQRRLVILADPMQLIYGFRGSTAERLRRHCDEADEICELRTPHRWHGNEVCGEWLLGVRKRLMGDTDARRAPDSVLVVREQYVSQMKARVKQHVSQAFRDGMHSVAILAAFGQDVRDIRGYLSRNGLYPRQLGGGDDFEDAHEDIELLPSLHDIGEVASRALDRVAALVPTLKKGTIESVRGRLGPRDIDLKGRLGPEARDLLGAFACLYAHGPSRYFSAVSAMLDACIDRGHHLPRAEAVRAIRAAADGASEGTSLDAALSGYSEHVAASSQFGARPGRGLYVMTAHQSKGKEFDAVVILNANERAFPDDEESQRLFYVAITRATKRWIVVAPHDGATPLLRHLAP